MKTKTSYGIALCRYNPSKNNNVEILLIKKRYSYYFLSFVMGHYKKSDIKYIKHLLDNMSFSEKIDILGMNFSQMWYRIWLNNPEKYFNIADIYKNTNFSNQQIGNKFSNAEIYKLYFQKKNRFDKNFLKDNGKKLRFLLQQSSDSEILWEMPKGGKQTPTIDTPFKIETNIDCAMREFYEETSIKSDKYQILYNVEPLTDSFVDNDTNYKSVYYLSIVNPKETFTPQINFKNFDQIVEVEQVRWVSMNEIRFFNLSKTMHNRLIQLYTGIIDKFKKYNKQQKLIC